MYNYVYTYTHKCIHIHTYAHTRICSCSICIVTVERWVTSADIQFDFFWSSIYRECCVSPVLALFSLMHRFLLLDSSNSYCVLRVNSMFWLVGFLFSNTEVHSGWLVGSACKHTCHQAWQSGCHFWDTQILWAPHARIHTTTSIHRQIYTFLKCNKKFHIILYVNLLAVHKNGTFEVHILKYFGEYLLSIMTSTGRNDKRSN